VRSYSTTLGVAGVFGLALALQAATGCGTADQFTSGDPFTSVGGEGGEATAPAEGGGGSGTAGSVTAGTNTEAGTPGSGGTLLGGCRGPEDCSDGDPCTQDVCRPDGVCVLSPKCAANQQCCEGDCGECCEDTDCDDNIGCTDDECFAGTCMHIPDSASCGAGKYCSLVGDCMAQEPCNPINPAACDDGSLCTKDACAINLCVHDFCSDATQCCPETGCANECCADQECDTDSDPCTVGVCAAGVCSLAPRCGDGEQCCATADGASCGSCCSAEECSDDVDCTVDSCVEGRCYNPPGSCEAGFTCDPVEGCTKDVECESDAECTSSSCGRCEEGTCAYGCGAGLVCCDNACQECCGNADCFDGIDCTDNACINGVCKFTANNKNCPLLHHCNVARRGCVLL
jgi:hypothetical protein